MTTPRPLDALDPAINAAVLWGTIRASLDAWLDATGYDPIDQWRGYEPAAEIIRAKLKDALAAYRARAESDATRAAIDQVCPWCAAGSPVRTLYYGGEAVGRGPAWHGGGIVPPDPSTAVLCAASGIWAGKEHNDAR